MADPVVEFCETVVEAWLFEKYPKVEPGVIKLGPIFLGGSNYQTMQIYGNFSGMSFIIVQCLVEKINHPPQKVATSEVEIVVDSISWVTFSPQRETFSR